MKFESRVSSMSTEDIIADTIGEEAAKKLLYEVGGITGALRCDIEDICAITGITGQQLKTLEVQLELLRRTGAEDQAAGLDKAVADLKRTIKNEKREFIGCIYIGRNGCPITTDMLSYGGPSGAYLDFPTLLRRACRLDAHSIILMHNHPDGSTSPSREDYMLTDYLTKALRYLGMNFIAHYIVSPDTEDFGKVEIKQQEGENHLW